MSHNTALEDVGKVMRKHRRKTSLRGTVYALHRGLETIVKRNNRLPGFTVGQPSHDPGHTVRSSGVRAKNVTIGAFEESFASLQ